MKISCPDCGKHFDIEEPGRYQCPSCNTVFDVEREDTAQVPGLATCPYCKGAVNPDARKCTHCGEWIVKRKSKVIYFLIAMFLPAGLLGFAEWYIGRKKTAYFLCLFNISLPFIIKIFNLSMVELLILLIVLSFELLIFSSGFRHIDKLNGESSANR